MAPRAQRVSHAGRSLHPPWAAGSASISREVGAASRRSASVCSGFFGEPDSFSMYGSNRVKRRPSPYEMEITDGEYGEKPKMWRGIIMGCREGHPPPGSGKARHRSVRSVVGAIGSSVWGWLGAAGLR